jgi:hypothetical protein
MNNQTQYAIELYALYETPASVYRKMKAEFGSVCLSAQEIKSIREKYRSQILKKREELKAKIPLLDAHERWAYLQTIIDGALEGEIIYDKRTNEPLKAVVDRNTALQAVKLANDMATTKGTVNTEDDEMIKSIVMEAFEERKAENPKLTDEEILKEILETLGEKVAPFIEQIKEEINV